jgi:hypothetical protein
LLLVALAGLAFVGGFLLATRRREPAVAFVGDTGVASPGPSMEVRNVSADIAGTPPSPDSSSGAYGMPYDIDEDAPLASTPPPHNHPD